VADHGGRTVQFAVDGAAVGSAVSDATGAARSWTIPASLAVGAHNVTVSFVGDSAYNAATRTSPVLTVLRKVLFSQYATSGAPGQSVTLKTLVYSGGAPVSGLSVKFAVDGTVVGMATSDASNASRSYTIPASMSVGTHDVTVSFAGNATYAAASRTTAVLTVATPKANVLFSLYAVAGAPQQTVTLKTLVYSGGSPASGLLIQFAVDGAPAGSATSGSGGAAVSYTIPPSMTVGAHDVTVTFAGDATHNAATRTSAVLTVK